MKMDNNNNENKTGLRELDCFDKLKIKLTKFQKDVLISSVNSVNLRLENRIKEDTKDIVMIKSFCCCPYETHRSFGFSYYCLRERVTQLVDEFGVKYDFRKKKNR